MSSQRFRAVTRTAVLLALMVGALAATPSVTQAGALAQYGCGVDSCGVVPAAWDNPSAYGSFADAVNFTNYVNVTNYVGYTNVVNAVNYTNQANAAVYRNAVRYATWAAER
jgi:hypothetical protein